MSWIASHVRHGVLVGAGVLFLAACQATTDRAGRTVYSTPTLGQVIGVRPQSTGPSVIPAQTSGISTEQRVVGGRTVQATSIPGGHQIVVDGRVLATDRMSTTVTLKGVYQGSGHTYVVVEEISGGTACPSLYQAVDLTGATAVLSPQFGTCSDIPRISVSNGSLMVVDPGFGAARPARFSFRDGHLTRSGS